MNVLILDQDLHEQLQRICEMVQTLHAALHVSEIKLRGILYPFYEKQQPKKKEKKAGPIMRKRWDRMVEETTDGVGRYAIEVFRF